MTLHQDQKNIAKLLKILANENRLLILCALSNGNKKTVSEIHETIPDISLSALSQHLRVMRTSGILATKKSAQYVTYSIEDSRVVEVHNTLKKYYCKGGC